jgi:arsenite/tail-anchored protein-transporting ATPase
LTTRTILFTGKGGVGKTTVAAATALRCAENGQRTLVISTDTAHSLADAFAVELGNEVRGVTDNLWGHQLDTQRRMEESWVEIRAYLLELFDVAGVEGIAAEELAVVPGLDELFALADIRQFSEGGDYDVLVVDCAPTAETIRLLSLPDVLEWYMERLFPIGRRLARIVGPVLGRVSPLPIANDDVFGAAHRLYAQLAGVREILTDARRSSVRLVVNPERMVVAEARRTQTYLSLFGYPVDAVVANRVLPDAGAPAGHPWLARWAAIHAENLEEIRAGFAPLPVLRSAWAADEPVGVDGLRALAEDLYGDRDPAMILHTGEPFGIARVGGGYELRVSLPNAAREEVEVSHQPGELLLRVGPYRRAIVLPDALRRRTVSGARLADGVLLVTFDERARSGTSTATERVAAVPAR